MVAAAASTIALCDQAIKAIVVEAVGPGRGVARAPLGVDWIAVEYAENRGAAFGLFSAHTLLLTVVSIAVLAGVVAYFLRSPNWTTVGLLSIGAIVGGASGNLIDRVRLGFVVDFVAIGPWPNFNLADSAVTLGVIGLFWNWMRMEIPA